MVVSSISAFLDGLRSVPLLDDAQLAQLDAEAAPFDNPTDLAKHLIRSGWITLHQGRKLLAGHPNHLVLGPYLITDKLGEGGMGKVYKGLHRRLGRVVALKLLRHRVLSDPRVLKRFRREAETVARLHHPNIVRILDAHEDDGEHYLVMEFIDGTDLSQVISQTGTLPIHLACEYMRQTAVGLQHAHEQGLIHRDIKPANLLITTVDNGASIADPQSFGVVKILDMGLARPSLENGIEEAGTSVTQDGTVVGTPDFMAPEQAKNSKTVDARADIYSLGCTLYFLLTGKAPFRGETTMEKLLAHQTDPPPSITDARSDAPPELAEVLDRLLAKQPGARYPTAAAVAAALESLAIPTADAIYAPPTSIIKPASDPAARLAEPDEQPLGRSSTGESRPPTRPVTQKPGSPFAFDTEEATPRPRSGRPPQQNHSAGTLLLVLGALFGIGVFGLGILLVGSQQGWFGKSSKSPDAILTPENNPEPSIRKNIVIDDDPEPEDEFPFGRVRHEMGEWPPFEALPPDTVGAVVLDVRAISKSPFGPWLRNQPELEPLRQWLRARLPLDPFDSEEPDLHRITLALSSEELDPERSLGVILEGRFTPDRLIAWSRSHRAEPLRGPVGKRFGTNRVRGFEFTPAGADRTVFLAVIGRELALLAPDRERLWEMVRGYTRDQSVPTSFKSAANAVSRMKSGSLVSVVVGGDAQGTDAKTLRENGLEAISAELRLDDEIRLGVHLSGPEPLKLQLMRAFFYEPQITKLVTYLKTATMSAETEQARLAAASLVELFGSAKITSESYESPEESGTTISVSYHLDASNINTILSGLGSLWEK